MSLLQTITHKTLQLHINKIDWNLIVKVYFQIHSFQDKAKLKLIIPLQVSISSLYSHFGILFIFRQCNKYHVTNLGNTKKNSGTKKFFFKNINLRLMIKHSLVNKGLGNYLSLFM